MHPMQLTTKKNLSIFQMTLTMGWGMEHIAILNSPDGEGRLCVLHLLCNIFEVISSSWAGYVEILLKISLLIARD